MCAGGGGGLNESLKSALAAARELPADELPSFLGELETIKAMAWARLASPAPISQPHDELLGVTEAARRLGVSQDYLYAHHKDYHFTGRQGRKLLFSAQGIERHIKQK